MAKQTCLRSLRLMKGRMWHFASRCAKFSALAPAVHGLLHYLWRNGGLAPNYADAGEPAR
jgi:hypothetical protein